MYTFNITLLSIVLKQFFLYCVLKIKKIISIFHVLQENYFIASAGIRIRKNLF